MQLTQNKIMKLTGNEPATGMIDPFSHATYTGLTKREYFAALAITGFISAGFEGMPTSENLAKYSVEAADALIKELNKEKT